MYLTATQFKNNFGEYLSLAAKEDIYVTKNNKVVAKVSNPSFNRMKAVESLFGTLPPDFDTDRILAEKRERI